MDKLAQLLDFGNLYFSHPYWAAVKNPWLRIAFLPSKRLLKKSPGASATLTDGKNERTIFRATFEDQARKAIAWNEKGFDAYYFLNAVRADLTMSARNEHVEHRLFYCIDLDFRLPLAPLELCDEFGLSPAWIVSSSERDGFKRYQIAWGVNFDPAPPGDVRETGRELCHAFGSDSVHDAKRILRLPGTINWKGSEAASGKKPSIAQLEWRASDIGQQSFWDYEEFKERIAAFSRTALSAELGQLGLRDLASGGRAQGPGGDFGRWEKALEKAALTPPERTVAAGGRHNALISWGMQMLNQGIAFDVVRGNLDELRRVAFSEPYVAEDDEIDFQKLLRTLREKKDREDAVVRDAMAVIDMGDAEIVELNIGETRALVPAPASLVNGAAVSWDSFELDESKIVDAEFSVVGAPRLNGSAPPASTPLVNPIPGLTLSEYADRLALQCEDQSEKEWLSWLAKMVVAINLGNIKDSASLRSLGKLIVERFKAVGLCSGRFFSIPVFEENNCRGYWTLKILSEDDAKTFAHLFLLGVHAAVVKNKERLAAHPMVKKAQGGNKKFKLSFNCQRAFISEVVDLVLKLGISNRQPVIENSRAIVQNGIFDVGNLIESDHVNFVPDSRPGPDAACAGVPTVGSCLQIPGAVNVRYVPSCTAPLFAEFLLQTFPDDPDTWELIYRIVGYCLLPGNPFQRVFSFEGIGGGGKGILAEIIMGLVGPVASQAMSFMRLANENGLGPAIGKSVIFVDEAEDADKRTADNAIATIKKVTSGGIVPVKLLFENERQVLLGCKFILASNKQFSFDDASGGGARRFIPLHFAVKPVRRVSFGLSSMIVEREGDAIASEALRRLTAVWHLGAHLFDVEGSLALEEGRERLALSTQGLKGFLVDIVADDVRGVVPGRVLEILVEVAFRLGRVAKTKGRTPVAIKSEMEGLGYRSTRPKPGDAPRLRSFLGCRVGKGAALLALGLQESELVPLVAELPALDRNAVGEYFEMDFLMLETASAREKQAFQPL